MIPAFMQIAAGQLGGASFPHTPENHWAYETMFRAGWFSQYPGIGSVRLLRGNYPVTRIQAAKAWFEGFTAVHSRHTRYYREHISQYETSTIFGVYLLRSVPLSKTTANELQRELDFIYEGLYRMQFILSKEIEAMKQAENQEAIENAKMELRVIHLESELPKNYYLPRKRNMDLRDAVVSEGR